MHIVCYMAVIKRRKEQKKWRECERSEIERQKAAKGNRIYLPMRMSCRSEAISPRPVLRSLWWWEPTVPPPSFCTNSGRLGTSLEAKSTSTLADALANAAAVVLWEPLLERLPDNRQESASCKVTRSKSPRPSPTAITRGWWEATIGANATTSGSRLSTSKW